MNNDTTIDPEELAELVSFAQTLADKAGEVILPHFRKPLEIEDKGDKRFDPVTQADRQAEEIMREAIAAKFPNDGIIGEEFGAQPGTSGRNWVLDPIDGTRSFIYGLPIWGILIGLEINGAPVLGLMDQPFTEERFWGAAGQAHYIHKGQKTTLKTNDKTNLKDALLAATTPDMFTTNSEKQAFAHVSTNVRETRFGGDCYFYCQLAAGQIDLVVEAGLKIYDILALIPIIEGAGGVITDWQGGAPGTSGQVIAAANQALHASALEVIKA